MLTLVNMDKKYFALIMGIKRNFAIFTQLRKMAKKKMPYSYLMIRFYFIMSFIKWKNVIS
jgi:hypothetical protein